ARNSVQLTVSEPEPRSGRRAYARSADALEEWLADETLIQDHAPALYLLDQEFEVGGERKLRRACISMLRIEAFGKGCVLAHEETPPGPEKGRLELLRATQMNICPVLGLYSDEDGAARAVIDQMAELEPVAMGMTADGVKNVLRVVYHHKLIDKLIGTLSEKQVVIVDGHHCYEAALAHRDRRRQRQRVPTFDEPHEFIAAAFVAMDDPGLLIRPTHRLISGLRPFRPRKFFDKARADYDVEDVPPDASAILARLGELDERHAFGVVTRGGAKVLVRKTGSPRNAAAAHTLDTHVLRRDILGGLLALDLGRAPKTGQIGYSENAAECVAAVSHRRADLSVLVNPPRMEELEAVVFAGSRMPPKSAAIYPRLPGGIVMAPLI
ncbi:MAG: DUF1015 domain-containing protein, partial [Planctomycetota bacterium]